MELQAKQFGPLIVKNADQGEVEAVVATIGVVDREGDVILPGALPDESDVVLSGYNHDVVFEGAPPVGKGKITVEGDKAVFRGRFFLSTDRGRESFETVKELGEEGEWSFGFPRRVKTAPMTDEWREKGARRLIAGILPLEASPVWIGAGVGTGTLAVRSASDPGTTVEESAPIAVSFPAEEAREDLIATLWPTSATKNAPLALTAKADSLNERIDAVWSAVWRKNEAEGLSWWVREIFDAFVVVQAGNRMLRVDYTVADDGTVALGAAVEVEIVYQPVGEAGKGDVQPIETMNAGPTPTDDDAEVAAIANRFSVHARTAEALAARAAAEEAEAKAARLEAEAVAARERDREEQGAIVSEFERFQRTARRLGVA